MRNVGFCLFLFTLLLRADTGSPVTACSAVRQEQVQAALGRSVGRGVETNSAGESTCDFRSSAGIVSLTIHTLDKPVSLPAQQTDLKSAFPDSGFQAVQLGAARGFLMVLADAGVQLHVAPAASRRYVIVTVMGYGSGSEARSAAYAIARLALP